MPEPQDLDFMPVALTDYDRLFPYTSVYGEGSCQHSPVSMYSLAEKYGDSVCIKNGFLYTLRSCLCDEQYRVYLAPLGGGDGKAAFLNIIEDAQSYGRKVQFVSLTEKQTGILEEAVPDRFEITESRDLAEYIYRSDKMAFFPGGRLKKRRNEVNAFWSRYRTRAAVTRITQADHPDILAFERKWVSENSESHDAASLEREERMIRRQLAHFDELHLSGIVLRIDGQVHGFGYGMALNNHYYDAIVEKGNKAVDHIYKVLRQESVRQCALEYTFVNVEEDVGVPGLRALKMAYQPEFLLRKFVATERDGK